MAYDAEGSVRGEGRVLVRRAELAWLEPLGLTSVAEAFALPGERRGSVKSLVRLVAPSGEAVFVKRWDCNRPALWLRSALKGNFPVASGLRELENLLALSAAGLRVPVPLAAGDEERGLRRRSFVALAQLAGQPLADLPPPPDPAERRARLDAVADLARRLHGAGFWHKDLYACNLFWAPGLPLGLLDCERVLNRPGGPPWRWRVKDLAALDLSAPWPSQPERLRWLLRYLDTPRLDPPGKRLARSVRGKARRMQAHGAKGP